MFRIVAVFCLALAVTDAEFGFGSLTKSNTEFHPRVVGGVNAALGDFPWQASLQLVGVLGAANHFCGGTILSPKTVLTAGQCVTGITIAPGEYIDVRAGLINLKEPVNNIQRSTINKTIVHPYYQGGISSNDLAIHILNHRFLFNYAVQAIALPRLDFYPSGNVTLSGWGSTSTGSSNGYTNNLKTVDLPVIPFDECLQVLQGEDIPLDNSMICTGPLSGGYGACSGDSGSPLVLLNEIVPVLVGIVSWGFIPCGQANLPSVSTNVGYHTTWINSNIV